MTEDGNTVPVVRKQVPTRSPFEEHAAGGCDDPYHTDSLVTFCPLCVRRLEAERDTLHATLREHVRAVEDGNHPEADAAWDRVLVLIGERDG